MKYIIKSTEHNLFYEDTLSFSSDKKDAKVFSVFEEANAKRIDLEKIGFKSIVVKK